MSCDKCGATRFFRVNGNIQCRDGHVMRGIQESNESQEASRYATRTTTTRKNKKKKLPSSYNPNEHFHGTRADFLRFQCLQWVLRQQIRIMIDQLGYPKELEFIAKDLWAALVASSGITDGPSIFYLGEEGEESYSGTKESGTYTTRKKRKLEDGEEEEEEESENEEERLRREAPSSDEEDGELPASVLLERSQAIASQIAARKKRKEDKEAQNSNPYHLPPHEPSIYAQEVSSDPRLTLRFDYTLIIIYLSCIALRLPVFFSDIVKLAESQKIPFLNARYFLPEEMREHLNTADLNFFDPSIVTRVNDRYGLGSWLPRITNMMQIDWNIHFPEYNMPLMTWRICKSLGCSPVIYTSLRTLLSLLPTMTFEVPVLHSRGKRIPHPAQLVQSKALPPFSHKKRAHAEIEYEEPQQPQDWDKRSLEPLPELILVSALVVLVKLIYGGSQESILKTQLSNEKNDILLCLPSLRDWISAIIKLAAVKDSTEDASILWRKDVSTMTGEEIDGYLSFCEANLPQPAKTNKDDLAELNRYFPLPETLPTNSTPAEEVKIQQSNRIIQDLSTSSNSAASQPRLDSPALGSTYLATNSSSPTPFVPILLSHIFSILDLSIDSPTSLLPIIAEMEYLLANRTARATREAVREEYLEKSDLADEVRELEWQRELERRAAANEIQMEMRKEATSLGLLEGFGVRPDFVGKVAEKARKNVETPKSRNKKISYEEESYGEESYGESEDEDE